MKTDMLAYRVSLDQKQALKELAEYFNSTYTTGIFYGLISWIEYETISLENNSLEIAEVENKMTAEAVKLYGENREAWPPAILSQVNKKREYQAEAVEKINKLMKIQKLLQG